MSSLRDILEAALVENPDDLATHNAYADYLQEQGDPRGEFIALQLASEDPRRSEADRRRLQERIDERLQAYRRDWAGVLADELFGPIDGSRGPRADRRPIYDIRFARGWLDCLARRQVNPSREPRDYRRLIQGIRFPRGGYDCFAHQDVKDCSNDLGRLMCRAPETRLLRTLILEYNEGTTADLIHSPYLGNLRVLQIGSRQNPLAEFDVDFEPETELDKLVVKLPRLEELYLHQSVCLSDRLFTLENLTNLRVLEASQINDRNYPIVLASNPAFGRLTHLYLRVEPISQCLDLSGVRAILHSPHLRSLTHLHLQRSDLGDVGCTEIVTSGILKRLKVLDLRNGEIGDSGARTLADCPDLRNLELLDVGCNALSQTGMDDLSRILGPAVRVDNQQTAEQLERQAYLREPDCI